MKLKLFVISIAALFITGCGSAGTKYDAADYEGDVGYSESQITEDRYRVTYTGSTTASDNKVKDFALLRAAEVTLLSGNDWFRVVNSDSEHRERSTPGSEIGVQHRQVVTQDCGLLGCSSSVSPVYTGVSVSSRRDADRLVSSLEIVMGKGDAPEPTAVYDAMKLKKSLSEKYAS